MTRRAEFTRKTKLAAWERDGGRCRHGCGKKLHPGDRVEYDHIIRCELKPDNSLENCQVLCGACHDYKTHKQDAPAAAKSRRVRAAHAGASKPKHIMPGSRGHHLKKLLDGTVVPRGG